MKDRKNVPQGVDLVLRSEISLGQTVREVFPVLRWKNCTEGNRRKVKVYFTAECGHWYSLFTGESNIFFCIGLLPWLGDVKLKKQFLKHVLHYFTLFFFLYTWCWYIRVHWITCRRKQTVTLTLQNGQAPKERRLQFHKHLSICLGLSLSTKGFTWA